MFSETMEVVLKARMDDIRTETERAQLIRLAQAGAQKNTPSHMRRRMLELSGLVYRWWETLTQQRTLPKQESTPTL